MLSECPRLQINHTDTIEKGVLGGVTDTAGKTVGGVTDTAGNAGNPHLSYPPPRRSSPLCDPGIDSLQLAEWATLSATPPKA